jgi:hypothetical protein
VFRRGPGARATASPPARAGCSRGANSSTASSPDRGKNYVKATPDALAEPVADLKTCRDKFASWWPFIRTEDLAEWRAQAECVGDKTD